MMMYTLSLELIKMVMNSGAGTLGNGGESVQKPIAQVNRPRAKKETSSKSSEHSGCWEQKHQGLKSQKGALRSRNGHGDSWYGNHSFAAIFVTSTELFGIFKTSFKYKVN
jgi:hypothetical protein